MKHVRDYAFNEQKGGTKGEHADYILQEGTTPDGKTELRYVPVLSKIKLNKKRNANRQRDESVDKVDHIVVCPRSLTFDEAKEIKDTLK